MKAILISFLLAAALVSAADKAPLSGKWQVHIKISDHEADDTCTFVQNGDDLTGSCNSARGAANITGKIEGRKITWVYKSNSESNGTITLKYRGALNSDTEMSGFVTVEEYGIEGEFTATQSS